MLKLAVEGGEWSGTGSLNWISTRLHISQDRPSSAPDWVKSGVLECGKKIRDQFFFFLISLVISNTPHFSGRRFWDRENTEFRRAFQIALHLCLRKWDINVDSATKPNLNKLSSHIQNANIPKVSMIANVKLDECVTFTENAMYRTWKWQSIETFT